MEQYDKFERKKKKVRIIKWLVIRSISLNDENGKGFHNDNQTKGPFPPTPIYIIYTFPGPSPTLASLYSTYSSYVTPTFELLYLVSLIFSLTLSEIFPLNPPFLRSESMACSLVHPCSGITSGRYVAVRRRPLSSVNSIQMPCSPTIQSV